MTESLKNTYKAAAQLANDYVAQFGYNTGVKTSNDIVPGFALYNSFTRDTQSRRRRCIYSRIIRNKNE